MIPQGDSIPTTTSTVIAGAIPRRAVDAETALARLAALRERTERMTSTTRDMTERLQELRSTARDPNEIAEATVDAAGNLVDLRLSEQVLRLNPGYTAGAVMEAVTAAKAQLAELTREIINETIGSDSETGKAVLEHMDRRLNADADGGEPR